MLTSAFHKSFDFLGLDISTASSSWWDQSFRRREDFFPWKHLGSFSSHSSAGSL
jgi:hypothetical protein